MHLFNWLRKLWSRQTVKNKHTENKNRYAHTWCFQITWLRNNMTAPSNPAQTSISEAPTWCCRNGRLFNITRMQTLDTVMDDRAVAEAKGCHWQDLWWHETGWFACQWVGKTGWFVSPDSAFHRAQPTRCKSLTLSISSILMTLVFTCKISNVCSTSSEAVFYASDAVSRCRWCTERHWPACLCRCWL